MSETNGYHYPFEEEEECGLTEESDHLILMHRDAHFGGDFQVMINYYENENHIGIDPELELDRILYLAEVEKEMGTDLAPLILVGPEAERVAKARKAYESLKDVYDSFETKSIIPRLIADLILSEEEEPDNEIEAVISQGARIVPELLAIIQSEESYDPFFPGYGYAPYLAIICVGKIGDPRGVIPLFETLGKEIVFDERVILEALYGIGEPAKQFLLKVLQGRPLTNDHIHAAYALTIFSNDVDVISISKKELQDPAVFQNSLLRSYLECSLSSEE